jgi:hypothetical protein
VDDTLFIGHREQRAIADQHGGDEADVRCCQEVHISLTVTWQLRGFPPASPQMIRAL